MSALPPGPALPPASKRPRLGQLESASSAHLAHEGATSSAQQQSHLAHEGATSSAQQQSHLAHEGATSSAQQQSQLAHEGPTLPGTVFDIPTLLQQKEIPKGFVRACYPKMLEVIKQALLMSDLDAIAITGTPGMGKTVFLSYMYLALKQEGRKLTARVWPDECLFFDGRAEFTLTDVEAMEKRKESRETLFLLDSSHSEHWKLRRSPPTIVFCSPCIENFKGLVRNNVLQLLMPPWELDELRECFQKVYPLYVDQLTTQYELWGGSIRAILMSAKGPLLSETLHTSVDLFLASDDLLKMVSTMMDNTPHSTCTSEISHFQWLFHRIPSITDGQLAYVASMCTYNFPSSFIKHKVYMKLRRLGPAWWEKLGNVTSGLMYEEHVLNSFFAQTRHPYLKRTNSQDGSIMPYITRSVIFSRTERVVVQENVLYIPLEKQKEGVDCVLPPWLIQITTNKSHPKLNVQSTLGQFPSNFDWKLCVITITMENFHYPKCQQNLTKYYMLYHFADSL